MHLFKTFSLHLALMTCTTFHVMASQEVMIERNPNLPRFSEKVSPHQSPTKIKRPIVKPHYKTLEIDHPLNEHELGQLMDRDYSKIYLHSVYIGYEQSKIFAKKASLTISPEVINPGVEVLSLKCCGITDDLIKGIQEFKALKKLILFSNHITDSSVISAISQLKNLESLSLINEEISNASVLAILDMPNLTELDLSHNKRINDEIAETLLKNTNLKKLNVRFTGLTRQKQRLLEKKYKILNEK